MEAGAEQQAAGTLRPRAVACVECGDVFAVKRFGPVPRFCSPRCRRSHRHAEQPVAIRPAGRPLISPNGPPALPASTLLALPARTGTALASPAREAEPEEEPFFASSERVALAPHLPVEQAPVRKRRRATGSIGSRERSDVRLAVDVVAFAVVAAAVLIGSLTWFGPAGFVGWLLVAVPVLWFSLVDPHMRARYR